MSSRKTFKICFFALLACFFMAEPAQALTPEDFKTPEYQNSTGLWVINAANAYAKGYTGKGIKLGVLDSGVNWNHFEFQGKNVVWVPCEGYVYDWLNNKHGSHVAGIMAARRDGVSIPDNMHGVAFNADLIAMGAFLDGVHDDQIKELIKAVLARPDVKIVNNSWVDSVYIQDDLFEAKNTAEKSKYWQTVREEISRYTSDSFLENLAEQDKLMVFAAGNAGHRGASLPTSFPAYLPTLNNWLSVVALDSTEGRISLASDGKTKILDASALSCYSDLALGTEEFTLAAPGTLIFSVNAAGGYVNMSGTSMAAPYVSGTLGLVQQAFPWMTAKQLADTVLSTADRQFSVPKCVISVAENVVPEPAPGQASYKHEIRLQVVDAADRYWERNQHEMVNPAVGTSERARLEEYLRAYYKKNYVSIYKYYFLKSPDEFVDAFFATKESPHEVKYDDGTVFAVISGSLWSVPFDQIFGQGILDAGKAVDGLSQLNANRMSPSDVAAAAIQAYTGKEELLYAVDTKGYIAAWNNDISQELWHPERHTYFMPEFLQEHPNYLATMEKQGSVGLLKSGQGILFLTGTNSYAGSTVIEGGTLSISRRADQSGGQLTASEVYVLPEGRLQGDGVIQQGITNWGVVSPGNSIGTLTAGNYTQHSSGTLLVEFDAAGHSDRLKITGSATLDGSLTLVPMIGYYRTPISFDFTDIVSASSLSGALPTSSAAPDLNMASPTLTMRIANNSGSYTLSPTRAPDAYSQYATSGNAARAGRALPGVAEVAEGDMQELLTVLDFSAPDGGTVRAALPQLTAAPYARAAQASAEANLGIGRMALAQLRTVAGKDESRGLASGDADSVPWSAFVMPFGGGSQQQEYAGAPGYSSSQAGLMGGVFRQGENLNMSLYTAFSRRQVDMWTSAKAQARSNALHVGAATLWSENSHGAGSGWQAWAQAQVGVENTDMRRSVEFTGYARQNSSFYTSFNAVAQLGGGYLWKVDAFSLGPRAGLEYAVNVLPPVNEEDGGASRLSMDAYSRHDVRGTAGLTAAWNKDLDEGRSLRAKVEALWRQDLLPEPREIRTHLVGYGANAFDTRMENESQGSLGLSGGLEMSLRQDLSLSAQVEADLRSGYSSVGGGLSLRWEF